MASFTEIPILDLSLARDESTKPQFLRQLRETLLEVGFMYISNTGISQELYDQVCHEGIQFFEKLPDAEKLKIEMKNQPSFLGYSKLGNEITAFQADWREQLDLSTPHPSRKGTDPPYYNLLGPNQWPSPEMLPTFRPIYERYITEMSAVSIYFTSLIAESLDMQATAFDKFFDKQQQHKLKVVKYPDLGAGRGQGVGPHKDSMLTSYLLQASPQKGLQAQNTKGEWIDCPPIRGTLVVAIGQGLEAVTGGVCTSTTHRVLSPEPGQGARYSIPFFQGVSYDATFESMDVPEHVRTLRKDLLDRQGGRRDDVEFTFVKGRWRHLGEATLMNRIKSHTDVGEKWYPDLLEKLREQQAQDAVSKSMTVPSDIINNAPLSEQGLSSVAA
ncbi:hypothetical protein AMS68_002956 [Peltaster fructicola]|uniref:Fe2OG dioxygenase domain-containing protein n=1 Tax=Peltaster fructicola TaxID=286661 RepID=A0A6H0XS37_9PEZI|nr:hypothetical protein AMS68_002956 [Peltaster fructicola]